MLQLKQAACSLCSSQFLHDWAEEEGWNQKHLHPKPRVREEQKSLQQKGVKSLPQYMVIWAQAAW